MCDTDSQKKGTKLKKIQRRQIRWNSMYLRCCNKFKSLSRKNQIIIIMLSFLQQILLLWTTNREVLLKVDKQPWKCNWFCCRLYSSIFLITSSKNLSWLEMLLPESTEPYTTDCSCSRWSIPKEQQKKLYEKLYVYI